jgi:hypothetical protein
MNSNIQELKIFYQTCAKKFILPPLYEDLLNTISISFNLTKENIYLNYIDDEGDKIVLSNELDYEQVIKICEKSGKRILKMNLEKHSKDQINLSEITQSVLTIELNNEDENLQIRENENEKKEILLNLKFFENLKTSLKNEIEEKVEEFKHKIINVLEHKIDMFTNTTIIQIKKDKNKEKLIFPTNLDNKIKFSNEEENLNEHCNEIKLDKNSSEEKTLTPLQNNFEKSDKSLSFGLLSHDKESKDCIVNFALIKNCRRCGDTINIEKNNFYFCLNCEDVFYCNMCFKEIFIIHGEKEKLGGKTISNHKNPLLARSKFLLNHHINKHILINSSYHNFEHFESVKQFRNFRKLHNNKNKMINACNKYFITGINQNVKSGFIRNISSQNDCLLLFNNMSNKVLIEIEGSDASDKIENVDSLNHQVSGGHEDYCMEYPSLPLNTKFTENNDINGILFINDDFLNIKINLINLSSDNILRNSYLECIFDQSDIFGNKILIEETIQSFEEFELNIAFYNFKNKPNGFYISLWKLVRNENIKQYPFQHNNLIDSHTESSHNNSNLLRFVFIVNKKNKNVHYEIKEKRSESLDFLRRNEMELPIKEMNKLNPHNSNNISTGNLNRLMAINTLKIPDLFGEVIKKHQEIEKEKEKEKGKKDS